jgi:protease secretion system outer membrane protein
MLALAGGGIAAQETSKPGFGPAVHASRQVMDLSRAWELALENDHRYRAAISEHAASQTERAQGRAELLPHVEAGYYRSKVKGNTVQHGAGSTLDFDSINTYVQVRQPLLNPARYARYQRGYARADMGAAVFRAKYAETGIRLADAYFNALLAYERYVLQHALTVSLQSRLSSVQALYRRQEATRIEVQETRSRLAMARADQIAAEDSWKLALRELESLLGVSFTHLAVLRDELPLPPLEPATLDEWLHLALAWNAEVEAARRSVRVARTEVDVAVSEYMPTVDLVAAYGKLDSENLSSLNQRSNSYSVGIQVSIPLFAGGYNRANVARSRSDRMRLQEELRAAIERTQAEVVRHYTNVRAGADLVHALRAAEAAGQLSLMSASKGFTVGVASNLDVLKVQERLHQTRHDLAKAELDYVMARLKLLVAAGMLQGSTFHEINDVYLGPVATLAAGVPSVAAPDATFLD